MEMWTCGDSGKDGECWGNIDIWRYGDMKNMKICTYGDMEIWRHEDMKIWKCGDVGMRRCGEVETWRC